MPVTVMFRPARAIPPRLHRQFIAQRSAYSTAPVPAKTVITPELELADEAKQLELRSKQAPNRTKPWATSQRPRSDAFDHPRFEGAILEMQVCLLNDSLTQCYSLDRWRQLN
jgi:hypothetical protein